MKRFTKYSLFVAVLVLLSVGLGHAALASDFEVNYPDIPGAPKLDKKDPDLFTEYISYVFFLAFTVAGIIGVISLAIGGVQILASAGNPAAISDARDRLFSTILGIILLFLAYVILATINPQLVNLRNQKAPFQPRVVLVRPIPAIPSNNLLNPFAAATVSAQSTIPFPVPPSGTPFSETYEFTDAPSQFNSADYIAQGYTGLYFLCDSISAPPFIATFFHGGTFQNEDVAGEEGSIEAPSDSPAETRTFPCYNFTDDLNDPNLANAFVSLSEFTAMTWGPFEDGIYLCLEANCQGACTGPIKTSGRLPRNFQGNVASGCVKNDFGSESPKWGFLLSNDATYSQGTCTRPVINTDSSKSYLDPTNVGQCFNIASCQDGALPSPTSVGPCNF